MYRKWRRFRGDSAAIRNMTSDEYFTDMINENYTINTQMGLHGKKY